MTNPAIVRQFVAVDVPGLRQAHGSTVLTTQHGTVLVAWFAGSHEGAADSRILLCRKESDADDFGDPIDIWDAEQEPHWNPVLAQGPDQQLWLIFKRGERISQWRTFASQSADDGRTWSEPGELVPGDTSGGRGPVRQAPLVWGDYWLAGGSTERWSDPARWDSWVDVTSDAGRTWRQVAIPIDRSGLRGAGTIQPWLWRNRSGGVTALCRTTEGVAYRASARDPIGADPTGHVGSPDGWTALRPTNLPNNNSGLAALALPDGRIVCVHNPSGEPWGPRCPLVLSISDDDGVHWQQRLVIDDGKPFPGSPPDHAGAADGRPSGAADTGVVTTGRGEYSYPAIVLVGEQAPSDAAGPQLLISYSWQRRGIVLARLPVSVIDGDTEPGPISRP